jgi:hypothetical protein
MTYAEIRHALLTGRRPHNTIEAPGQAGVYALFLQPRGLLTPIEPGPNRLLYIGMTKDGLDARNHFEMPGSGFSTLRRTLGALLRRHLALQPAPRAPGPSESNTRNYMFSGDGETVLSRWMRANLLASHVAVADQDLEKLEADLIADLKPPLNLTGWDNPQRPLIKKLRADCVSLAEASRKAA